MFERGNILFELNPSGLRFILFFLDVGQLDLDLADLGEVTELETSLLLYLLGEVRNLNFFLGETRV